MYVYVCLCARAISLIIQHNIGRVKDIIALQSTQMIWFITRRAGTRSDAREIDR